MIKKAWMLLLLFSLNSQAQSFQSKLVKAAKERTEHVVVYNGSYQKIDYPNGDVPKNIGVCTDVIIRTYRALGIDLQALVHEDMRDNFILYPSKRIWGLTKPDTNIDHRRVPNLQVFFERHGESHDTSNNAADYQAGDIVTWVLPNNRPHIGIVTDEQSKDKLRPLIVHNIGWGPKMEDMLFNYKITGHYRFEPNLSE
ncbi:DUF1287 domain-containing protein [Pseudoalteromonas sp. MEBiC 03485]|uniref:DUF1287 domain-containing protein n=1 Tax=Pseudoalteromonas sp. MEBiC 03485 TaxID=2571103 RepID=UPI00101F2E08|nr:DUF1287 domain-containing protein [Pseudoalteromonas sp. MEBiC 03485]RZD22642.1 DUF1287 domain-containing protein [Pseudoalteromonas sp. MEBiC 03485]